MRRLIAVLAVLMASAGLVAPAAAHPNHYQWFPSGCYNQATPVWYEAVDHIGIHSESSYVYATSTNGGASFSYYTTVGPIYGAWAANGHECGAWGKPTSEIHVAPVGGGWYEFTQSFQHRRVGCIEKGNNYSYTANCASFWEVFI